MKYLLVILLSLSLGLFAKAKNEPSQDFDKQMEAFYPLVELSLVQRAGCGKFVYNLEHELEQSGHLSAQTVHKMKKETVTQVKLRKELLSRSLMYEPWIKDKSIESQLRLKGVMFSLSAALVLYDNYLLNIFIYLLKK